MLNASSIKQIQSLRILLVWFCVETKINYYIGKMAVELDNAHQELSNAFVVPFFLKI